MTQVRVLLVDDSREFLDSAAAFLARDPRVLVVGRARDGQEGLRLAEALAPDLVLIDLAMPVMDGLTATRGFKARPAPPRVIVLTLHDDPEYRRRADDAGADGFVGKTRLTETVPGVIDEFFAAPAGLTESS